MSESVSGSVSMNKHPNMKCEKSVRLSVSESVSGSVRMKKHPNMKCEKSVRLSVSESVSMKDSKVEV